MKNSPIDKIEKIVSQQVDRLAEKSTDNRLDENEINSLRVLSQIALSIEETTRDSRSKNATRPLSRKSTKDLETFVLSQRD